MTTIYDIAKAAGVTATTVSNVLSGKGSVSASTKARVLKYVRDLGYQPNLIARSLIKGRTGVIGLILAGVDNPFYAETTTIVERLAYVAGLRVFTTTLSGNDQVGQKMLQDLILRQVDGILVTSWTEKQIMHARASIQLPVVHCFWEEDEPAFTPYVAIDLKSGGTLAGQHLLSLGHQRLGVITHLNSDGGNAHGQRIIGFQTALSQHGLSFDATMLLNGWSSLEGGKTAAYKLLTLPNPPTAIFATNDAMAIGAMAAAWELGLQIPRDLSIVGLDDVALAKYVVPPLTTVAIDKEAILSHAIKLLLDVINGQEAVSPPPLSPTLVVRGSTGPCLQ
jgi:DNA-binding LacI/PurR family transcriptional regulator